MRDFDKKQLALLARDAKVLCPELRRNQFLDDATLAQLRNERFVKMVHHAYANVAMYRRKYDGAGVDINAIRSIDDAKHLPIIEKQDLIDNYPHDAIAKGYELSELTTAVTGGSSGSTVTVAYSERTMRERVLTAYRIYDMMMDGYRPEHVQTYVYTGKYPLSGLTKTDYRLEHIWTLDPLDKAVATLRQSKPHMLTLYPSRLEDIRRHLTPGDVEALRERLIVINVKSEMSTQDQRDEWSDFFGVPVLDEYGSEELAGTVAAQCRHGGYHIWEDIQLVEIVSPNGEVLPDGEEGDLVATCYYNWAMPIIRYRQNDIASLKPASEKCACDRNLRMLATFSGRQNSSFVLPSGRFLSSGYLLDIGYTRLMDYRTAISGWALILETPTKAIFECIPGRDMNEEVRAKIASQIGEFLFGELEVEVRLVDELPTTNRGKRNQIINRTN
ncbi:phenylacetate--CoA ligase family protein [Aestuariibius sp. 2305UL40-4]|uniref:phenylacetate--CoA ligase family protein n=1 Tax=Aestuariibius violaceus TaxID=3234132 RepID=UPI00345EF88C